MKPNLLINGIVILIVAIVLNFLRGMLGGILNTLVFIAVIILAVVGIIRIVEALITSPVRPSGRIVHHVHHYRR